jgi:prevent-host-death family protein
MQREATAMNVRQNLGELLNEVQYKHDEIVITKAGKPVAAMIDMAAYERVKRWRSGEFERSWAAFAKGFDDLSEQQAQDLADQVLEEARQEIALRTSPVAAQSRAPEPAKVRKPRTALT